MVGLLSFKYIHAEPALGVSVKSVRLVAGRLGFYSRSGLTKDFKNSIRSFRARHKRKCEGFCVCVVRHVYPLTAFNHSSLIIVIGRQLRMA